MKKIILSIISLVFVSVAMAQTEHPIEMADTMRQDGKIYVVVGVITTVFLVMAIYLFVIDRKVSQLEKKIKK